MLLESLFTGENQAEGLQKLLKENWLDSTGKISIKEMDLHNKSLNEVSAMLKNRVSIQISKLYQNDLRIEKLDRRLRQNGMIISINNECLLSGRKSIGKEMENILSENQELQLRKYDC